MKFQDFDKNFKLFENCRYPEEFPWHLNFSRTLIFSIFRGSASALAIGNRLLLQRERFQGFLWGPILLGRSTRRRRSGLKSPEGKLGLLPLEAFNSRLLHPQLGAAVPFRLRIAGGGQRGFAGPPRGRRQQLGQSSSADRLKYLSKKGGDFIILFWREKIFSPEEGGGNQKSVSGLPPTS